MTDLWDVLIVGAGPAGASAAYFLGERGLRALVLEQESLPHDKPCGGAVPRSALRRFPFDFEPVIEDAVSTVQFAWNDVAKSVALVDTPVVMVRRREFDTYILSRARAEVVDRVKISEARQSDSGVAIHSADGRTWRGRYLLVAEGSKGTLTRSLGLSGGRAGVVALEAEVPLAQAKNDWRGRAWFQFGALPGGYLWVFPKRDHLSVGIVDFRGARRPLRAVLASEMTRLGIGLGGVAVRGHPLPVFSGRRALGRGRVMLLGDAAGLVDPLLGEGIRYALRSGQIAADVISCGESAETYTRRIAQTLWPSLTRAREIAGLFYRCPRPAFAVATYDWRGAQWMIEVLTETSDYVEMSYRLPGLVLGYLARKRRNPAH